MSKKLLIFVFFILMIAQSCSFDPCGGSKEDFLDKYSHLIEKVKKENLSYSDNNWKSYDDQFKTMVESCYETFEVEMSTEELAQFWTNALAYYHKRYGTGFVKELKNKKNPTSIKIKKHLKNLGKNTDRIINSFKDQINKESSKRFSGDVGKWGKKMEEIFKKK